MPLLQSSPIDIRKEASNIEQSFVAISSRKTYNAKLTLFLLWLYDNHPEYLVDDIVPTMIEKDNEDTDHYKNMKESATRSGSRMKTNKAAVIHERKKLRAYCQKLLNNVKPSRNGEPHGSPIKIEGPGALSYEVVRDYMATKRKTSLVDHDSAEQYLKSIGSNETHITDDMIVDGKV